MKVFVHFRRRINLPRCRASDERPVIMGVMVGQLRTVLSVLSLQYRRFGRTNMKPDNYTYALAFERCSRCGKINWSVSYRQSQSNHVWEQMAVNGEFAQIVIRVINDGNESLALPGQITVTNISICIDSAAKVSENT